jgi:hypothetical protein
MNLPVSTRLFSLVAAVCIALACVITIAEIGHPPPDGIGAIASLVLPHDKQNGSDAGWGAVVVTTEP